jgi:hypothetical protein
MKMIGHKFWMGFNSFVLLFLAVNIATIGVEAKSNLAFIVALGYMVYMSVYLSKSALWKVQVLMGIGLAGAMLYLTGIVTSLTPSIMHPLAIAHIVLSAVLAVGALAHLKAKDLIFEHQ